MHVHLYEYELHSFKKADLMKYILGDPFMKIEDKKNIFLDRHSKLHSKTSEQYTDLSPFLLKQNVTQSIN